MTEVAPVKTVITFGTFDLFHIGHLKILERASKFGERLVVGVSSDELNEKKKGFKPLFSERERLAIISSIKFVDEVFLEESLELKGDYIRSWNASILVMGHDWHGVFDIYCDICEVKYLERTPDISSRLIKERLRFPL